MEDLGELSSFLGTDFRQDNTGAWLSQSGYIRQVLIHFGMEGCRTVSTPVVQNGYHPTYNVQSVNQKQYQELVRALVFISTRTRQDISNQSIFYVGIIQTSRQLV